MATSQDYIEYVCEQIASVGFVRYKKMFGEYMVYVDEKPVLLVCDNTVFAKKLPSVEPLLSGASCGFPYDGAKEHYILDIDDAALAGEVARTLAENTPLPKSKKKAPDASL